MGTKTLALVTILVAGCGGEGTDVALSPLPSPVSPDNVMVSALTIVDQGSEVMIMGAPGAAQDAAKVRVTRVATKLTEELTVSKSGSFGSTFQAAAGDEFQLVTVSAEGRASAPASVTVPPQVAAPAGARREVSDPAQPSGPAPTLTDLGSGKARLQGYIGTGMDAAVLNMTSGAAFVGVADAAGLVDVTIDADACDQVGMFVIDPAHRDQASPMQPMPSSCGK